MSAFTRNITERNRNSGNFSLTLRELHLFKSNLSSFSSIILKCKGEVVAEIQPKYFKHLEYEVQPGKVYHLVRYSGADWQQYLGGKK